MGTISLSAQKLHTHYSFLPQEGGNLYFIMPQKGFQTQDKKAKKKLIYDVAYLYPQDSATVNYTYFHLNRTNQEKLCMLLQAICYTRTRKENTGFIAERSKYRIKC